MRIAARLARWFGGGTLERDVRDEVEFHIDMRAAHYVEDGMRPEDAAALALRRFGDKETIMNHMRSVRLTSASVVVAAASTAVLIGATLWMYRTPPVMFPAPAPPTRFIRRVPPPPPRPGPTWEEFVKKVNTFGDGSAGERRRR